MRCGAFIAFLPIESHHKQDTMQRPGAPGVDRKRVKARKDAIVAAASGSVEQWMRGLKGATVYRGHARFTGSKVIKVNNEELSSERIFVDVGGRPLVPKLRGIEG